jgi:large subunit ribosomal protein L29
MRELKAEAVRQMTLEEVEVKLRDLREEQFNLRFRNAMKQLDNPLRIRAVRRAIARLETLRNEHAQGIRPLAGTPSGPQA